MQIYVHTKQYYLTSCVSPDHNNVPFFTYVLVPVLKALTVISRFQWNFDDKEIFVFMCKSQIGSLRDQSQANGLFSLGLY